LSLQFLGLDLHPLTGQQWEMTQGSSLMQGTRVFTHPTSGSQLSTVQALLSSQFLGLDLHPLIGSQEETEHLSDCLHA
jgi:prephenate dehydrogenase